MMWITKIISTVQHQIKRSKKKIMDPITNNDIVTLQKIFQFPRPGDYVYILSDINQTQVCLSKYFPCVQCVSWSEVSVVT